jgi:hypothetical protein
MRSHTKKLIQLIIEDLERGVDPLPKLYAIRYLTPQQQTILYYMLRPQITTFQDLFDLLYGDDQEGGPNNPRSVIATRVSQVRKYSHVKVSSYHGTGYSATIIQPPPVVKD